MKKRHYFAFALSTAALAVSIPALAGNHLEHHHHKVGGYAQKMFEAMDANADGQVTQAEFDAHHAGKFQMLDADGDGAVTPDEFEAKAAERRGAMQDMQKKRKACKEMQREDSATAAE
ncbi:MAG TPA: hypothetical protein DDX54_04160 [Rhodospirillaceae bacterium]|jgi:hypothetical protein|nr:hypothetical protein [Alphaproteobacteria bacterium]HBH26579.1 hypothetical protein [Rhodospirillaceae bacterium]